ncbi:hypothetical protein HY639_02855 [Candidatus Woesearchaeota archaeon]|nr:hypothetical protein [Candidatus Woesearchaeota archaeon]
MTKGLVALLVGTTLTITGCGAPTFETELKDILQREYTKTQEEAEVAVVKGERDLFLTRVEKDGKEAWKPNYNSVTIRERITQTQQMANDLDQLLSYKNKDNTRFLDEFGIRDQLEKDEQAIQFNLGKQRLVALHKEFQQKMGLTEEEAPKVNESMLIYPLAALEKTLLFDARYVQEARTATTLVPFDDLEFRYKFEQEIPNPAYPNMDPVNQTIWIPLDVKVRLVSYDADSPRDHKPDYLEVYRLGEKTPAIKIFHSTSSNSLDVAVVDVDKEGERGHGVPDEVLTVWYITRASDVYDNYKHLLAKLFQEKKKLERVKPLEREMDVQIVPVGDLKDDAWEYDTVKGFSVPLEYQDKDAKNYTLAYKFLPKTKDTPDGREHELAWVAKRWKVSNSPADVVGRVVTYHKVLPAYKSGIIGIGLDRHRLTMTRSGQPDVTGLDSLFIEREPYKITYDWGASRWIIEDRDNKSSPKYEARYEQVKPLLHELDEVQE